ncbi:molybdopterin-binding protein [Dehalobacter sp. DCM]|uniref:molybdopterin-binding protein n=1 Tax=Dehalobacter sp. DCM TaxID=2907827 RepID=UPI003081DA75|nr:molybdopterin-binding protein [Dehalobacter sp. DCM]
MKTVAVEAAEGMVLGHDLTQIVPGKFKGVRFRKGHIIKKEDIPHLLNMGKKNIFVWDLADGFIHEDEAALRIAKAVAGNGLKLSVPREGKVELSSEIDGLLKVNLQGLDAVNTFQGTILSCLHTNQRVTAGKVVAGTRIIPLVIENTLIKDLEDSARHNFPVIEIKPYQTFKVGIITTGSEVYEGRIKDAFGPVLRKKVEEVGSTVLKQVIVSDSVAMIVSAIQSMVTQGADLILTTGGMSVDPDDVTPEGIRQAGGRVVTYGAPVLPGAMFMMAYIGDIPVMGLPGCVMYSRTSIFDLIFPRVLAGEIITRDEIIKLGHGSMCLSCPECTYPDCGFGK